MMNTTQYPNATLALTKPIVFANNLPAGQSVSTNAAGALTLRGVTHPVSFTFTGRYDGSTLGHRHRPGSGFRLGHPKSAWHPRQ